MKKMIELLKEYYGIIGFVMILIGSFLMFSSLVNTKLDYLYEKLKNERLKKKAKF